MAEVKLCIECKHLWCDNNNGVWFNYRCTHPELNESKEYNYVTGSKIKPKIFCRDINKDGNCKYYSEGKPYLPAHPRQSNNYAFTVIMIIIIGAMSVFYILL